MDHLPAHFAIEDIDHDVAQFLFLDSLFTRAHHHVVRRELKRPVPLTALPARARNVRTVDLGPNSHLVAELDDTVVHVRSWKASAYITASAVDQAEALAVVEEIRGRVPVGSADGKVDVAFSDEHGGSRYLELDARPWPVVRGNYTDDVRDALDDLMTHTPDEQEARRLLLWHG
ncbi:MAG: DUF5925 domain-containing protein, partial [Mycobacteriales bacterium]